MEPIAQRLYDYFFKYKGYKNDTAIANMLGYSHPEKISRLFRPGSGAKPSVDILGDITNKFGNELNISWVLTGQGDMIAEHHLLAEDQKPYKTKRGDATLVIKGKDLQKVRDSIKILASVFSVPFRADEEFGGPVEVLPLGKRKDQGSGGRSKGS